MCASNRRFSKYCVFRPAACVFLTLAAWGGSCLVDSAEAVIVGPYSADANTLHLWHLDEAHPGPAMPASGVSGSFNLTPFNGATMSASAFPGFGTSANTSGGANSELESAPVSSATVVGSDGAFTFEALVNVANTSATQQIISMSNAGSAQVFQFRIGGGELLFVKVNGVGGTDNDNSTTIPIAGPEAFVANEWYHVAATYNGVADTPDNLKLYWTKVDGSRTFANQILSTTLNGDLDTASLEFRVGNRVSGGNLNGLVDEVRISDVPRGGDAFLFAKSLGGNLLLADNFNSASTGLNADLASRQSGLLATTTYSTGGTGAVTVASNRLLFDNTATGSLTISPDVDFAAGPAAAAIEAHGGFTIDFDVNPVANASDTGMDANWFAVSLGHTAVTRTQGGGQPAVTLGNVDAGILFRDNGGFNLFEGGASVFTGTFDVTPSGGEFYNVQLVVETDAAASGNGLLSAFVNGVQLDLGGAGLKYAFTWDGEGTNYLALESRTNDAVFDNLYVSAFVPEPSSYALLGIAFLGLLCAARRKMRRR